MKNLLFILGLSILFSSCFKEEDKRAKKSEASVSLKLGEDYGTVFYYNLSTQTIVKESKWDTWNLAFYAQEDANYIKLNDAANMKAIKTGKTFNEILLSDTSETTIVDNAKGYQDSIALKYSVVSESNDTSFYTNEAYILLLGTEGNGTNLGHKKVQLLYTYQNQYVIRFANLDGTDEHIASITKNTNYNFIHFSFKNGGKTIDIEPDKTTWDIVFTRTTDITTGKDGTETIIIHDYSVTSVLLNPFSTKAYLEKNIKYEDFISSGIESAKFSSLRNTIGYDWKAYDLQNSVYAIRENRFYVIKDINDFNYKFKFLSFNDPVTNIKGTISFTYEIVK